MTWLPGWDSIESTDTIGHLLHVTAVIVLGLLFLSEGMALVYDSRHRVLSAFAEKQRQRDADATEDRRKAEVQGLQTQLSAADQKLAEIERLRAPRHLTTDQKAKLTAALVGKPIGRLVIKASMTAPDANDFGKEIAAVFQSVGWNVPVDNAMFMGGDTSGVWITVRSADIPIVANVIYNAFKEAKIPIRDGALSDANGPAADEAWLKIGSIK